MKRKPASLIQPSNPLAGGPWIRQIRLYMTVLLVLSSTILNLMCNNMSMAITCMINNTDLLIIEQSKKNISFQNFNKSAAIETDSLLIDLTDGNYDLNETSVVKLDQCRLSESDSDNYEGHLSWSVSEQSQLFSGLILGALLACIPGGLLADRFGPKNMVLVAHVLAIIASVGIPIAAQFSHILTVLCRFVVGVSYGLFLPAMFAFVSSWYPIWQQSVVTAAWIGGNQISVVIAHPTGAYFCSKHEWFGGWPLAFITWALISIIWCIIWLIFATNSPIENRWISQAEKLYLESTFNETHVDNRQEVIAKLPWKDLFKCVPLYSCMFAMFSYYLFLITMMFFTPMYMRDVLTLDIQSNGFLSVLPVICQWISMTVLTALVTYFVRKKVVGANTGCRISNSIASFIPAACLAALGFVNCENSWLAVMLLTVSFIGVGGTAAGAQTSQVCLAPAYSGTVSSIVETSAIFGAFIGPFLLGRFVTEGTAEEWRMLFLSMSAVLLISGIQFNFLGQAVAQKWAQPAQEAPEVSARWNKSIRQRMDEDRNPELS